MIIFQRMQLVVHVMSLNHIVLLLCSAYALGSADLKIEPKIIGGVAVEDLSVFPYQVSLHFKGRHICGGSIINEHFILTAAHCFGNVKNIRNIQVAYGILNLNDKYSLHKVKTVHKHETYKSKTMENDIALLQLMSPIKFSKTVKPIELQNSDVSNERHCIVSGWGVTNSGKSSNRLMNVNVDIIPQNICGLQLRKGMICAGYFSGGKDACQGDSGGPLVCNEKLSGVVSWGIGCGEPYLPGVYTEVAYYYSWINETMAKSSSTQFKINTLLMIFILLYIIQNIDLTTRF